MQIFFNKTIEECRQLGARGGRAYARNLRLRQSQAPVPLAAYRSTDLPIADGKSAPCDFLYLGGFNTHAILPFLDVPRRPVITR